MHNTHFELYNRSGKPKSRFYFVEYDITHEFLHDDCEVGLVKKMGEVGLVNV